MGPSQSNGLGIDGEVLSAYSIDSKNPQLFLTYLSHRQTNKGFVLREMTYNDLRQYTIFSDKIKARKKLKNDHLTQLIHSEDRTEDNMCSNFYKIYSLWQYPKRTLAEEIKERSLQKKPFEQQQLFSILACSIMGLGTMQQQDYRHESLTTKAILTDQTGNIKIVDPLAGALVTNFQTVYNNRTVQNVYLSPEQCQAIENQKPIINKNPYKNDVFTMGVILLQCSLLERQQQCYLDDNSKINWSKIDMNINRVGERYGEPLKKILAVMLERDLRGRPDWLDLSNTVNNQPKNYNFNNENPARTSSKSFIRRTVGSQRNLHQEEQQRPVGNFYQPQNGEQRSTIISQLPQQTFISQTARPIEVNNAPPPPTRVSIPMQNIINNTGQQTIVNNGPTSVPTRTTFTPAVSFQPPTLTQNRYFQPSSQQPSSFAPTPSFSPPRFNPPPTTYTPPTFFQPTTNPAPLPTIQIPSLNNKTFTRVNSNPLNQPVRFNNPAPISFNNPSTTSFYTENTPRTTYQPFQPFQPFTQNPIRQEPIINIPSIQSNTPIGLAQSGRFAVTQPIVESPNKTPTSPMTYNNYIRPAQSVHYQAYKTQSPELKYDNFNQNIKTPEVINDDGQLEYVQQHFKLGSRYQGYKLKGMRHGKGKFYYQDGGSYDGYWKYNKMQGYGSLYYQSNAKAYEGYWVNDQFQGRGKLYNESPMVMHQGYVFQSFDEIDDYWEYYDGDFEADLKHGRGTLKFSNGEVFQGTFKEDMVDGQGVFYCIDGRKIHGIWSENQLVEQIQ